MGFHLTLPACDVKPAVRIYDMLIVEEFLGYIYLYLYDMLSCIRVITLTITVGTLDTNTTILHFNDYLYYKNVWLL